MNTGLFISLLLAAGPAAHEFHEASGIVGRKAGDAYTLYLIEDNLSDSHVVSGAFRVGAELGDTVNAPQESFKRAEITGIDRAKKLDLESIDTDPRDDGVLWLLNEGTASILLVRPNDNVFEQFREIALCESALECADLDSGVEGLAVLAEGDGYRAAVLAEGGDDGGQLRLPRVYVFNLDAKYEVTGPAVSGVRLDEAAIEELAGGDRTKNFLRGTDLVWFRHGDGEEHLLVSLVSMNFRIFNDAYIACFSQSGAPCSEHRISLPKALPKIHERRAACFNWEGLGWLDGLERSRLAVVNDNGQSADPTYIFVMDAGLLDSQKQ